jgi:hypothetical protein
MTFTEMRTETELLYESINSSPAPGFTPTEWGQILTVAQRKVVLDILKEGVTKNAFNQLAIEILIKSDKYSHFSSDTHFKNSDNTSAKIIDTDVRVFEPKFFWIIDEYVETASKSNIPIKRISFDFYRSNINNPFRMPNDDDGFWIIQYNNKPVFITDGTVITEYYLMGCYHPDNYPIAYNASYNGEGSCLNEGIHSKIVEKAVTLARMSVSDPQGYQLAIAEFTK